MKTTTVLAALGATVLLAACGGGSDEAREKKMEAEAAKHGIDADVELDDKGEVESVTIKNALGESTVGANLALPAGFPDDVFMDKGWNIRAVSPTPGVENGFMIHAATDAATDDLAATVRSGLEKKGWTEEAGGMATPQMTQLRFSKDDRMLSYNLMDTGAERTVQLVTMKMPE